MNLARLVRKSAFPPLSVIAARWLQTDFPMIDMGSGLLDWLSQLSGPVSLGFPIFLLVSWQRAKRVNLLPSHVVFVPLNRGLWEMMSQMVQARVHISEGKVRGLYGSN